MITNTDLDTECALLCELCAKSIPRRFVKMENSTEIPYWGHIFEHERKTEFAYKGPLKYFKPCQADKLREIHNIVPI